MKGDDVCFWDTTYEWIWLCPEVKVASAPQDKVYILAAERRQLINFKKINLTTR